MSPSHIISRVSIIVAAASLAVIAVLLVAQATSSANPAERAAAEDQLVLRGADYCNTLVNSAPMAQMTRSEFRGCVDDYVKAKMKEWDERN